MTSRNPTVSSAIRPRSGLLLAALLILPVPLLTTIFQTPMSALAPDGFEATHAQQLAGILASLREIRLTAEQSAAETCTALKSLDIPPSAPIPAGLPLPGTVTSGFGLRLDPFSSFPDFHRGVDIAAERGTPVATTADGTVLWSGWEGDYGKTVILEHPGGYATRYGHLDTILVLRGDLVRRGTLLGTVGDTGRTTGPHLHYEVLHHGKRINPEPYLLAEGFLRKDDR